ncbi:MAG: NAD(P)H-dependent oxidoreductase [Pseudolysinimonas sp.]
MTTLLHIASSPRGTDSESLSLASTFLDAFSAIRPDIRIDTWNLWDGALPTFGPHGAGAKMRIFAGEEPVGPQQEAWNAARRAFERVADADLYLFSVPMWNGGVPYILKQLIDVISQPGMVFGFDPVAGYTGLLEGKRATAIYTSAVYGPDRGPAFGSDFQQPYLDDWMRWAGVDDITSVFFRPNLATADADTGRRRAHDDARRAAVTFAARTLPLAS